MQNAALLIGLLCTAACGSPQTTATDTADSPPPPSPATTTVQQPTEGADYPVQGIDASHFQGTIEWSEVAASGKHLAIVKATEGLDDPDTEFAANWQALATQDMVRGAYHFFIAHDDGKAQAEFFLSTVSLKAGDLLPVLDAESMGDATAEQTVAGIQQWLDTVEAAVGRKPIIYTDPNFWNTLNAGSQFSDYPLWLAEYSEVPPVVPNGWETWQLWQYSSDGSVNGVQGTVDLDVYRGSLDELKAQLTLTADVPH